MKISSVPDGIYFLFPLGSAWEVYEFKGGHVVDQTAEANFETHNAAGDRWAGIKPSDDDVQLDQSGARAVIMATYGDESMVYDIAVYRMKDSS